MLKTIAALMIVAGLGGPRDWLWAAEVGGPRPTPQAITVPAQSFAIAVSRPTAYSADLHTQRQLYAFSCAIAAWSNAAGIDQRETHRRYDEIYGSRYPFETVQATYPVLLQIFSNAFSGSLSLYVERVTISAEALSAAPKHSVVQYRGHAVNLLAYAADRDVLTVLDAGRVVKIRSASAVDGVLVIIR